MSSLVPGTDRVLTDPKIYTDLHTYCLGGIVLKNEEKNFLIKIVFKIILHNYHPPKIVGLKIRVNFEISECTTRDGDTKTTSK